MTDKTKAKLTYFSGRGKAEVIRLSMAAAGIEWEEEHLSDPERVAELRKDGILMFEQVPLLEIDGMKLVQCMAIVRYLARKHGFMAKTLEEKVKMDMLAEGARDWLAIGFTGMMFSPADKRDGVKTAALEKSKSRYLPAFEKALKENGCNGFLVGDSLTMADLLFIDVLTWVREFDEKLVNEFPSVKKFYEKITSLPRIKGYLEGPKRFGHPDEEYVKRVKHAIFSK